MLSFIWVLPSKNLFVCRDSGSIYNEKLIIQLFPDRAVTAIKMVVNRIIIYTSFLIRITSRGKILRECSYGSINRQRGIRRSGSVDSYTIICMNNKLLSHR